MTEDTNEYVLWVLEIINEWKDINGESHRELQWRVHDKNLDLGSILNPKNKNIVRIKYAPRPLNLGKFLR